MKIALKIVGIIGLLFWTVCCFFGMLYAFNGRLELAIPLTLLIAVALFLSYLLMLKLQDRAVTQGNRDRAKTTGIIMLCVYIVATLCSAFYINHLVKVENEYKKDTKTNAELAIKELETLFGDKKTADSYEHYIYGDSKALATYETQLKGNSGQNSLSKKDESDMEELENWLLGTDQETSKESFVELKKTVEKELKNPKKAINKWNVFNSATVMRYLKELVSNKPKYEKQLMTWVKSREDEKYPFLQEEPFNYQPQVDCSNLLDKVTQPDFKVSITAILIMIALQVIILLAYLLGLKTGGKNDKIVTDDHGSTRSWSSTK